MFKRVLGNLKIILPTSGKKTVKVIPSHTIVSPCDNMNNKDESTLENDYTSDKAVIDKIKELKIPLDKTSLLIPDKKANNNIHNNAEDNAPEVSNLVSRSIKTTPPSKPSKDYINDLCNSETVENQIFILKSLFTSVSRTEIDQFNLLGIYTKSFLALNLSESPSLAKKIKILEFLKNFTMFESKCKISGFESKSVVCEERGIKRDKGFLFAEMEDFRIQNKNEILVIFYKSIKEINLNDNRIEIISKDNCKIQVELKKEQDISRLKRIIENIRIEYLSINNDCRKNIGNIGVISNNNLRNNINNINTNSNSNINNNGDANIINDNIKINSKSNININSNNSISGSNNINIGNNSSSNNNTSNNSTSNNSVSNNDGLTYKENIIKNIHNNGQANTKNNQANKFEMIASEELDFQVIDINAKKVSFKEKIQVINTKPKKTKKLKNYRMKLSVKYPLKEIKKK